jgi:hypothetical protein
MQKEKQRPPISYKDNIQKAYENAQLSLRGKHSITSPYWVPKFWLYFLSEGLILLSLLRRHFAQGLLHSRLSDCQPVASN